MPQEDLTLTAPEGRTTTSRGEVSPRSAASRAVRTGIWIVLGLAGGLVFIVVPLLHLITTWALPLAGLLLGLRAWQTEAALRPFRGTCPACGAEAEFEGGALRAGGLVDRCPLCWAGVEVAVARHG